MRVPSMKKDILLATVSSTVHFNEAEVHRKLNMLARGTYKRLKVTEIGNNLFEVGDVLEASWLEAYQRANWEIIPVDIVNNSPRFKAIQHLQANPGRADLGALAKEIGVSKATM